MSFHCCFIDKLVDFQRFIVTDSTDFVDRIKEVCCVPEALRSPKSRAMRDTTAGCLRPAVVCR